MATNADSIHFDPAVKVIDLGDGLWIERLGWHCGIDGPEDVPREIRLAAVFKISDLLESGLIEDEESPEAKRPWMVESQIYPLPEELSEKFIRSMGAASGDSREALIYSMLNTSGVPFDSQSVQPTGGEGCMAFSARISGLRMPASIVMPCFETEEQALAFCRERIEILPAVFGLIGFYLDNAVNRLGNTGWDLIYEMVLDRDLISQAIDRMKEKEATTLRGL